MILFPAIDIRNGKCVRLIQGDYQQETVYNDSPLAIAKKWEHEQAQYLHIVDLDGAKSGQSINQDLITAISDQVAIPIQVGGGIRTYAQIRTYLNAGIDRVVLGTSALQDIGFLKTALSDFSDRIAVSIDARSGYVAANGWTETSNVHALDFIKTLSELGVETLIYTDIFKDGMLKGPNFPELEALQASTSVNIIASGGITSETDVRHLFDMEMYGAIVGKALYDGTTTLSNLLEVR